MPLIQSVFAILIFFNIRKRSRLFTLGIFFVSFTFIAGAQTTTWTATGDGTTWTDGANWDNGVPAAGYDAVIGINAAINNVPTVSLNSLTVSGVSGVSLEAAVDGNVLSITSSLNIQTGSSLTFGDGAGTHNLNFTLTSTATATLNGDITITTGGLFLNDGDLSIAAASSINGAGDFTTSAGSTLRVASPTGITSVPASGNIQVIGIRSFSNSAFYVYNGTQNQVTGNDLPASVGSLTVDNSGVAGDNIVTLSGPVTASSLIVNDGVFNLGSNDATVGSVSLNGTEVSSSGGTLNLNGNITTTANPAESTISAPVQLGATSTLTVSNGAAVSDLTLSSVISGGFGLIKGGTGALTLSGSNIYTGGFTLNAGTVNINSSNALGTIAGSFTINGGFVNNTIGTLTLLNYPLVWNADVVFLGSNDLNLGNGNVTISANRQITVNGTATLTVGGLISATTVDLTKAGSGTLSFGGNPVSIDALTISGGTLRSTVNDLTINGNFVNSGTFDNNNGTVIYGGGSTQIVASVSYNDLSLSGAGQKNASGTVTVGGDLDNSSVFDLGTNSLNVTGTISNTGTLRFSGASNGIAASTGTVVYYGASQNIATGTYAHLTISQSGGEALLAGDAEVNGTLTLNTGRFNLGGYNLLIGESGSIVGGASLANMIIASGGGELRKEFNANDSFTFPIGDNTGMANYSPVTISVTGSGFALGAYIGLSVTDAKHPNNASTTNFLSRYWEVTPSGITDPVVDFTGTYLTTASDITGVEGDISAARINGNFDQQFNPWQKFAALGGGILSAATVTLTDGVTSFFSGIRSASPTITIDNGAAVSVCQGSTLGFATTLVNSVGYTIYSWSPATDLTSATIANPVFTGTTPGGPVNYVVTVRDGNGVTATDNIDVTVTPSVIVDAGGDAELCQSGSVQNFVFDSRAVDASSSNNDGVYSWSYLPLAAGTITGGGATLNPTFEVAGGFSGDIVFTLTAGGNGSCADGTDTFTLRITPAVMAEAGVDANICGITHSLLAIKSVVTSNGTWTVQNGPIGGVLNFSDLQSPATTATINGVYGNYLVRWTETNGVCSSFEDISLVFYEPPTLGINGTSFTICHGQSPGITLSNPNNVTGTQYVWTVASTNIVGASDQLAPVPAGAINTILNVSDPNNPGQVIYTVQAVANNCFSPSQTITVNVLPPPSFTATPTTSQICSGSQTDITLNTTVTGAQIRLKSVNYGAVTGTLAAGALYTNGQKITETLLNTTNAPVTVQYEFEAIVGSCAPSGSVIRTVTVNPNPTFGINNTTATICSGTSPSINVSSPTSGAVITLQNVTYGSITNGVYAGGGSFGTGGALAEGNLVNATNNPIVVTYTFRVATPGTTPECPLSVATQSTTVTVLPAPAFTTANTTPQICSGSPVDITLSTPVTAGQVRLKSVAYGAVVGNLSAGLLFTNGQKITEILTNNTNAPVTVQYELEALTGSCTPSTSQTVSVIVNPNPIFTITNLTPAICSGDTPDISVNSPTSGAVIALQSVTYTNVSGGAYAAGGSFAGSGTLAEGALTNTNPVPDIPSVVTYTFSVATPGTNPVCPLSTSTQSTTVTVQPVVNVSFFGLPAGSPPQMAENQLPIVLSGTEAGGVFTIAPVESVIGATTIGGDGFDKVTFDPAIVELGLNTIRYTYTDAIGCTDFEEQVVLINPVTSVDFIVEKATLNATQEWELCANQGLVKLVGNPVVSAGLPPETRFTATAGILFGNTINVVFQSGDYFIDTDGLVSDTYLVRYTFKNAFNAITFKEYPVRIFASPISTIIADNSCIEDAVQFNDGSTIQPTPFTTSITAWNWDFDDQSFSNIQNPSHYFGEARTHNIVLTVTTEQGCSANSSKLVRVGAVPRVDFTWTSICTNDFTNFENKTPNDFFIVTNYRWDFGDGITIVGAPGDVVVAPSTIGKYEMPQHNYGSFGAFNVRLTIETSDGCVNTKQRTVRILPFKEVELQQGQTYFEDFETTDGAWVPESLFKERDINALEVDSVRYSWIWNSPDGNYIDGASSGARAWWTGRRVVTNPYPINTPAGQSERYVNPDTYFKNETSALNGPCFNLSELTRPMIRLDYISDTELNRDGAVLQYSVDGGANWRIVGPPESSANRNEGINWYNSLNILGRPGNQSLGNFGWSGKTLEVGTQNYEWRTAMFNLDMIPLGQRDQVRFRVAFGSDEDNERELDGSVERQFEGFGIDNVFIGDKTRNVLIEHFTYTPSGGAPLFEDSYINGLSQLSLYDRPASIQDFVDIQYHMGIPQAGPLNLGNPIDPAARGLFMGVQRAPVTIMDGNKTPTGTLQNLNLIEIDRRSLEDPQFIVTIDTVATNVNNTINPVLTLRSLNDHTDPLLVNIALIETNVGGNLNVVRKLLYGPDGLTLTNAWTAGQPATIDRGAVEINVPVVKPALLKMVAFVQNKNTREIYQAVSIDAPNKRGAVIVGVQDDEPLGARLNDIKLYPNPASQSVRLELPGELPAGTAWKMADQRGVVVREGDFSNLVDNVREVEIGSLPNGVYLVIFTTPGGQATYKKLVVLNRN